MAECLAQPDLGVLSRETPELGSQKVIPTTCGISLHGRVGEERWQLHLEDELGSDLRMSGRVLVFPLVDHFVRRVR